LLVSSKSSNEASTLFQDVTDNESDFVDPALIRLSTDPWFTSVTDTTLRQAAQEVARTRLEEIIIRRAQHLSYNKYGTLDQLTRVAEESVIYDRKLISKLRRVVAMTISPHGPGEELPTVRALEEKLKARIMASLTKEAIREINVLVSETHEKPSVQKIAKDHLLERTTDLLLPQVEARVTRFVQSRVRKAARAGVAAVLKHLAQAVNEEEQKELLGGPIVDNVDYSFRKAQEEGGSYGDIADVPAVATPEDIAAHVLAHTAKVVPHEIGTVQPKATMASVKAGLLAAARKSILGDAAAVASSDAPPPPQIPAAQAAAAAQAAKAAEQAKAGGAAEVTEDGSIAENSSGSSINNGEEKENADSYVMSGSTVFLIIAVLGLMLLVAHFV